MEIVAVEDYWDLVVKSRGSPFVGIIMRVPPRLWRDMARVQAELKNLDRRQVYAKPSTFHITIKGLGFLGEKFDEGKLETLLKKTASIVSEFNPFDIKFSGLGMFPTSIHVRVEDPTDQLRMMNKRILQELGSDTDASEYDGDSYVPHVTLATFATKDADELIRKVNSSVMKDVEFGECRVFEVEAVGASMFRALGPEEEQDKAFGYLRSFQLGELRPRKTRLT